MSPMGFDVYNPTEEHRQLRDMMRRFAAAELEPQAAAHDERELAPGRRLLL